MSALPAVVIEPRAPHAGTVVWLHGLGASGHDFVPIVPHLRRPDLRFVFPHAPPIPVTINGGWVMPAWYDIRSLDERPDREDAAGLLASAARIDALVAAERGRGPVALLGFSQGAALALHVGSGHGERLAGIGVLSGYLACGGTLLGEVAPANAATPVLVVHGRHDDVVPFARGVAVRDRLVLQGRPVAFHERPIGHEVDAEEVAIVGRWLAEVLPGVG